MKDKEKINAIRAEVQNYIDAARKAHTNITEGNFAHLLSFIDSLQEEPVSEDLEEAAINYMKSQNPPIWGLYDGFIAGANWKEEQFEKNRLEHCNSITNEQAELEQGFIDQHLDKYNRMPTFLDAIEYGMRLQKEQMMKCAIDGEIGYWNLHGLSVNMKLPRSVEEGDKVKIVIVKSE